MELEKKIRQIDSVIDKLPNDFIGEGQFTFQSFADVPVQEHSLESRTKVLQHTEAAVTDQHGQRGLERLRQVDECGIKGAT